MGSLALVELIPMLGGFRDMIVCQKVSVSSTLFPGAIRPRKTLGHARAARRGV